MGRQASPRSHCPARESVDPGLVLSLSFPTPIGRIHVAASPRGVVRVELPGPDAEARMNVWLALHFPQASRHVGVTPILKKAAGQLGAYFTSGLTEFSLPLDLYGTPFQLAVWRAVATIPFNETRTYADIARTVGRAKAVRAVGAAQAANPVPIVVPCHRVIGSNGRLTGYGGGLEIKRWLLEHESQLSNRLAPTGPIRPPRRGGQPGPIKIGPGDRRPLPPRY